MKETFVATPYKSGGAMVITIPVEYVELHRKTLARKVRVIIQSTPKEKVD